MQQLILQWLDDMKSGAKKYLPGIAWFFILMVLICLPGSDLPHAPTWFERIQVDKWIHVFLFGTLAYLFMRPVSLSAIITNKWKYIIMIAIITSAWGLTTEFIQREFISGRSFDLLDWAADSLGALIAIFVNKRRNL